MGATSAHDKEKLVALLMGIGIVAVLLILASHHGHHEGGWRGPMTHGFYGPGMAPWLIFGTLGALLAAAFGLLPLALMVAGGYFVYRWFSGKGAPLPAFATRPHGPGGTPPPAEQGIFCPACNGPVHRNWATCPHCGYRKYVAPDLIQRRCANCGTELRKDWSACPYCSTRIDEPITMPSPPAASANPATPPDAEAQS